MNSIVDVLGDQLREHDSGLAMEGRVTKEFFPGRSKRSMNFEFIIFGNVCCGGIDVAHIGTMADFSHRVNAWQLKIQYCWQPFFVLFFIAQTKNRSEEHTAELQSRGHLV